MMEDGYNRPGFSGLDPNDRLHQLYAVAAINHVLFVEEGFSINELDPHDPNNSYLSELLDRKQGELEITRQDVLLAHTLAYPCLDQYVFTESIPREFCWLAADLQ